jgi:formylglycine-generating enzyme required for sulfatase activity
MEATLSVLSRPTGATIWLNNERREEKTPAKLVLPPGLYIVGVHAQGYVQSEERLTLKSNTESTVDVRLEPGAVPEGMVLVPAGKFIMGADGRAPDESPRREVELKAYFIDKYEVSNAQFKAVFPSHIFPKGMEDFPAEGVSWSQATEYARAVGKRLPTEAEWERAARGDDGREFPWGAEFNVEFANTKEKDRDGVVKPGTLLGGVSPFGCFDMAGNVYEWTQNWYEAYPGNTQVTKDYGQVYRVLRGGSYLEPQFQARCVRRHFDRMDAKKKGYGFRCAQDVPEE